MIDGINTGSDTIDTTLIYDEAGLLVTKADPCGCGGGGTSIYIYDAASRMVTMKDAATDANQSITEYDAARRVTKVTEREDEGTPDMVRWYGTRTTTTGIRPR